MLPSFVCQEESARRQEAERRVVAEQIEAERRATEQYKAGLDKEVQAARALAEAEGRIKEGRANEDINRRCGPHPSNEIATQINQIRYAYFP